jgi:hypothetical protein
MKRSTKLSRTLRSLTEGKQYKKGVKMKIIIAAVVIAGLMFNQSAFAWHTHSAHHKAHLKQGAY